MLNVLFSIMVILAAVRAFAGVPTDQVRGTVDRVLTILRDPTLKTVEKSEERRDLLSKVISARFDFTELARRSLGAEWRRLSLSQQQEFVELFTDLLRDAYIADIESYRGEKVVYTRETQEENFAVVQTLLKAPGGAEYAIDYRLQLSDREWKVYDLVIENVSVVNNYRSQFARIINRSAFEGLIGALKDKKVAKKQ